jgi:hypothetical protein
MAARYIAMSQRTWGEWRANWCFLEFLEADDLVGYIEPTAAPEVLPIWIASASMVGLEATVERIQQLHGLGLATHHVVNSFVRHNIAPLERRSCPFWTVLTREHRTRLHQDSVPQRSSGSNFVVGGDQTELWRPKTSARSSG